MLPYDIQPLPEQMLTSHQRGLGPIKTAFIDLTFIKVIFIDSNPHVTTKYYMATVISRKPTNLQHMFATNIRDGRGRRSVKCMIKIRYYSVFILSGIAQTACTYMLNLCIYCAHHTSFVYSAIVDLECIVSDQRTLLDMSDHLSWNIAAYINNRICFSSWVVSTPDRDPISMIASLIRASPAPEQ